MTVKNWLSPRGSLSATEVREVGGESRVSWQEEVRSVAEEHGREKVWRGQRRRRRGRRRWRGRTGIALIVGECRVAWAMSYSALQARFKQFVPRY